MPYTVAGTLKLPETGQPAAGVILKFIALQSISPVLDRSESVIVTSPTGAYSIQLEYNTYSVFATLYDNKPINCGQVVLNSTVATGLDLPTLLNGGFSEPTTPSWIVELQRLANVTTSAAQAAAASAAASSTSAAAAAASAAQASQISGLSTVAEAIGLAALPLPDVWAPLSDSLRLITGYGREVKVGDDVVAQMLNFSRNSTATYIGKDGLLKTAAVNEPRFEKEGLLIEGQSTNLFLNSENVAVWANPSAASASTRELQAVQGGLVTCKVTATSVNGGVRQTYNSPAGGVHTVSFYLSKNSQPLNFLLENGRAAWGEVAQAAIAPATGTITVVAGITAAKSIPFLAGYIYQLTLPAGKVGGILNAEWRLDAAGDMYIGMPQLEALPFASSYIPTAGAAVTRAADVCFIPEQRNIYSGGNNVSFCCEVDTKGGNTRIFEAGDATLIILSGEVFSGRVSQLSIKTIANSYIPGSRAIVAASISPARVTSRLNGIVVSGVPYIEGSPVVARLQFGNRSLTLDRPLNGHIRNFRIWHSALTDEQIKALK